MRPGQVAQLSTCNSPCFRGCGESDIARYPRTPPTPALFVEAYVDIATEIRGYLLITPLRLTAALCRKLASVANYEVIRFRRRRKIKFRVAINDAIGAIRSSAGGRAE